MKSVTPASLLLLCAWMVSTGEMVSSANKIATADRKHG
jgi:hypothetical protein